MELFSDRCRLDAKIIMTSDLYIKHGGIPVYNIGISHSWHEIGAVLHVIHEYAVDCFVEIGIHRGGLGSLLIPHCYYNPDFSYVGLDIDRRIVEPSFLIFANFLSNATLIYSDAIRTETVEMVRLLLARAKHPMIYCDGGNKPDEFRIYSHLIPIGGLIMAHDYPKEFNEQHFRDIKNVSRLEMDYLEGNRQILFEKINADH